MRTIEAQSGQSVFDIAIQELGSATGAVEIALANGISLTTALAPGQLLSVPSGVINKDVVAALRRGDIRPATAITTNTTQTQTLFQNGLFQFGLFE